MEGVAKQPPKIRSGAQITKLDLTPAQGFLLSRIDGATGIDLLVDLVYQSREDVEKTLTYLVFMDVLDWGCVSEEALQKLRKAKPDASPTKSESSDNAYGTSLTQEEKDKIQAVEKRISTGNYWKILELEGEVSRAEVKSAFASISRAFHPDRFFGRELGPFQGRLEKIFQRSKEAADVLSHDQKRKEYSLKFPPPPKKRVQEAAQDTTQDTAIRDTKASSSAKPVRSENTKSDVISFEKIQEKQEAVESSEVHEARLEARRQEIQARRRQRGVKRSEKTVNSESINQAAKLLRQAIDEMQKGNSENARRTLMIASSFDPTNRDIKNMLEDLAADVAPAQARKLIEQAEAFIADGKSQRAAAAFAAASDVLPQKVEMALRAARYYVESSEPDKALPYAERAVDASPRRLEARVLAGQICQLLREKKKALVHWKEAELLDRSDARVRAALKKLGEG
ncbi:DnaJ domain-containing protein [Myxococcota bacterium]|nr:DnaJ domain-containing protein [Myxococcota bacterium]